MKVNEVIKILSEFNPYADVKFNNKGIESDIEFYSWEGEDDCVLPRNIKKEKYKTKSVSFTTEIDITEEE